MDFETARKMEGIAESKAVGDFADGQIGFIKPAARFVYDVTRVVVAGGFAREPSESLAKGLVGNSRAGG